MSGIAEGKPGETPQLSAERFRKPTDEYEESFGRAIGWIAERLVTERFIGGKFYGRGEAIEEGMIRVVIEAPIMSFSGETTNADALLITKGLWACIGGFARRRGAMVRRHAVTTVRKAFMGFGRAPKHCPKDYEKREARRICQALGWNPPNLDAADAAALWWFACSQWAPAVAQDVRPHWLNPELALRGAA
ncbi:hypothetical protein [Enterovirga rhinocerotis]|uniref:hypothetical protein n=1 Tax=Enterovirga rhinocerotis TaxID=1339210 RepID=UPI0010620AB1|nr:hypothetical protein [Enterovirga rhinocerotis]